MCVSVGLRYERGRELREYELKVREMVEMRKMCVLIKEKNIKKILIINII